MAKTTTFLNNTDPQKVDEIVTEVEGNTDYFNQLVKDIVHIHSAELDRIMDEVGRELDRGNLDIDTIERYMLNLSRVKYSVVEEAENLSIKSDLASAQRDEVYNNAYLSASSNKDEKGKSRRTVSENTAIATNEAQYENVVKLLYEHAYSALKGKIQAAETMTASLSKVMTKRIEEMKQTQNTRGGLMG